MAPSLTAAIMRWKLSPAVVGAGEAVVYENLFQLPGALELLLQVVHENFPLILYTEALRPAVLPGQANV